MQHEDKVALGVTLYAIEVLSALWPRLVTDDTRALRLCCTAMRDAVDGQAVCQEEPDIGWPLLPATCTRLSGVHTLTLCSMECLRSMLVEPPETGAFFPRLQSLRLILDEPWRTCKTST
ncbi:hypothetical protein FOA52_008332 [Chlamydomonas sp. UWO 241]|nr:hypothetical protein FOA52_008332 [Chlamydomonas sp. UWO 241]